MRIILHNHSYDSERTVLQGATLVQALLLFTETRHSNNRYLNTCWNAEEVKTSTSVVRIQKVLCLLDCSKY